PVALLLEQLLEPLPGPPPDLRGGARSFEDEVRGVRPDRVSRGHDTDRAARSRAGATPVVWWRPNVVCSRRTARCTARLATWKVTRLGVLVTSSGSMSSVSRACRAR